MSEERERVGGRGMKERKGGDEFLLSVGNDEYVNYF